MRVLMAIVLCAGGLMALDAPAADAAPRYKRVIAKKTTTADAGTQRERLECIRARQEDPTREFAGFPCWAREAFARAKRPVD
jgi:hypothetical protein